MTDTYLTRQTLLRRLKSQTDEDSWEEFVSYYGNFIQGIIIKMNINAADVDDLSQTVLLKVWKALSTFDYNQKQGYFRNWLYTITKNCVLSHINKRQNVSNKHDKLQNEGGPTTSAPEIDKIIQEEWKRHISERAFNNICDKISESSLDAFQASLRGEPIHVTAERLGVEENTVYKYRNRVKNKLMAEIRNLRELLE